ncbi:hypothetical protein D9M72_497420 [compost metagenome]
MAHGQPIVRLGVRRHTDSEIAVFATQHRPGIEGRGQVGAGTQRQAVGIRGIKRPEASLRRQPRDVIGAGRLELLALVVGLGAEHQSFGATVQKFARARPVRLGIGIGIDRLRFRKSNPRADRDRAETDGRLQRPYGRGNAAAEGDGKSEGDEEGDSKQGRLYRKSFGGGATWGCLHISPKLAPGATATDGARAASR